MTSFHPVSFGFNIPILSFMLHYAFDSYKITIGQPRASKYISSDRSVRGFKVIQHSLTARYGVHPLKVNGHVTTLSRLYIEVIGKRNQLRV